MSDVDIGRAKRAVRERIWALVESKGAAPAGVHGYIPDFVGTDRAAARLAELEAWRLARVVKANPDRAQLPVRLRALRDGKLLYMAVPRLATVKPFYLLDPASLGGVHEEAATGAGAAAVAETVQMDEMRPVDLVVCGSVAVNRDGVRLGKGAGYSDIEVALLIEAGLIAPRTAIVTTVHELQVVDEELPEAEHDFRVDVIVTPAEVIRCEPSRRPSGIIPGVVTTGMARSIPVLGNRVCRPGDRYREDF